MNLSYQLAASCLIGISYTCSAQSTLSIGIRNGIGITPHHVHATFTYAGTTKDVKSTYDISKGVTIQYLINDALGIETGLQLNYHNYSTKRSNFFSSHLNSETIVVDNYQVPLLFIFTKGHSFNAFRHYKFVGGTSLDWFTPRNLNHTAWLKNIIGGIRIVSEKVRHGKIEYGLEYQYSLSRFTLLEKADNYNNNQDVLLNARISVLSITFHYFFPNIKFHKTDG